MSDKSPETERNGVALSRRGMLIKLGLAATAAYAAPVMLKLGEAHASGGSGGSGGGGRGGGRGRGGNGRGGLGRGGGGRRGGGRGSFSGFSGFGRALRNNRGTKRTVTRSLRRIGSFT